jgi:hypothetical protein
MFTSTLTRMSLSRGVADGELLVVVLVEQREGQGVVGDDFQQALGLIGAGSSVVQGVYFGKVIVLEGR